MLVLYMPGVTAHQVTSRMQNDVTMPRGCNAQHKHTGTYAQARDLAHVCHYTLAYVGTSPVAVQAAPVGKYGH